MPPSPILALNSIDFCIHKIDLMGIPVGIQWTLYPNLMYDRLSLPLMPIQVCLILLGPQKIYLA